MQTKVSECVNKQVYKLSPQELQQLQRVLLDMLIEFDRICKIHHIRYCIIAGTLLGAVRHKGFIPWDDDLDVALPREEYVKFRNACKSDLNRNKFFFQDNTTDYNYRWGWGRLRRLDSEFIRVGQEHLKMKTGIFLDVFPIDNVPDFPVTRGIFTFRCFLLRKILYSEVGRVSEKKACYRFVYRLMSKIPVTWVFQQMEKLQKYNAYDTKYARILTFPTPKSRSYGYLRKWYIELDEIMFEGKMFPCISDWHEYLTYKYGNYMKLPSEAQRHWHPVVSFKLPKGGNV